MTALLFALSLLGATAEGPTAGEAPTTRLTIDPCIDVDEATVREVMNLEFPSSTTPAAPAAPWTIVVECVADGQEIRVERDSDPAMQGRRTIRLPFAGAEASAAREARSRELALAIAELVRRIGAAPPPAPPAPAAEAPKPPAAPPPTLALATPVARAAPHVAPEWQLGAGCVLDYFTAGETLAGADATLATGFNHGLFVEVRAGGRVGSDVPLPTGHLEVRAGTVAASAGIGLWPRNRWLGGAFALRAQGYLVQLRSYEAGAPNAPSALLGAFVVAAEPRLVVAVSRHLLLEAALGIGFATHAIVVFVQGDERPGLSGALVSASLSAVVRF